MQIKPFIITIYSVAGLLISAITALMTFLIIDEPIGMKMFTQIVISIIFVLPIIIFISYYFGNYLSKKFSFIQDRLKNIEEENFLFVEEKSSIDEISQINDSMNNLSCEIDILIKDLKQKNQNLSNLLVSMAHDIKTPITILNGYVEEIEDGLIGEKDLPSVLKSMRNEIKFLDELTVDMLSYISSMHKDRKKEIINIYEFIETEIIDSISTKNGVEFINEVDEKISIEINKIDLKKIFINILTNAFRHTNEGYVKISALESQVFFENSGEKIKNEYIEKIFEPFFTACKSKNRTQSGFGLGLSIVKNLSDNNGFNCYVKESNIERTVFVLENKIVF